MNKLLGLDESLLRQTGTAEQAGYRLVNYLFLLVTALSVLANGYFGYLFLRTWWGALMLALLMGFIHFSVFRIALITLMTKPLIDKQESAAELPLRPRINFKSLFRPNLASLVRFVFIGLIALTLSFPLSTLFFHRQAMALEQEFMERISEQANRQDFGSIALQDDTRQAHYPFVIFERLWALPSFRNSVALFVLIAYAPLLALARLRYGRLSKYADLCRASMRQEILIDYQETLEQSQDALSKSYPAFDKKLVDLTPFSDAPFRQKLKRGAFRTYGSSAEFKNHLRSL